MPQKNAITLTELVLLLLVWGVCQTMWRGVVIQGLTRLAQLTAPGIHSYYHNVIVGAVLMTSLYLLVLLTKNIDIGRYKVFELND